MDLKYNITKVVNRYINEQTMFNDKFWLWFGDSKVVDDNGNPLICYHGTNKGGFSEFKPKEGYTRKTKQQADFGSHFSIEKDYAAKYATAKKGSKIYECYLKIENPLLLNKVFYKDDNEYLFEKYLSFTTDILKTKIRGDFYYNKEGEKQKDVQSILIGNFQIDNIPSAKLYDGLLKHNFDGMFHEPYNAVNLNQFQKHPQAYIVMYPNQIKSIDNDGSWDNNDNNIYS